jgi:hypothetical protein
LNGGARSAACVLPAASRHAVSYRLQIADNFAASSPA